MIVDFYRDHRRTLAVVVTGLAVALTALIVVRPELTAWFALLGTWSFPIGWAVAKNWETIESWVGRFVAVFGILNASLERVGMTADMQGQINGARKLLEQEMDGALPHPVRVKFVRSAGEVATLKEGEIVIALGDHRARAANMARSMLAYTSADLIRPARAYVEPRVMRSVDLSVTKRLLAAADSAALDYFVQDIVPAAIAEEPNLRLLCHKIETIERQGLLTRVLLAEFLELGRQLYPEFAAPDVLKATSDFVDYLYRVVTKRRDEELGEGLLFSSGRLRVGVVLVADRDLALRRGANPYIWRCLRDIRAGCSSVYLLARGANGRLIEEILSELEGNGRVLAAERPHVYDVITPEGRVSITVARVVCDQRAYRALPPEGEMAVVS